MEIGILRDELKSKNALKADYARLEQVNKDLQRTNQTKRPHRARIKKASRRSFKRF